MRFLKSLEKDQFGYADLVLVAIAFCMIKFSNWFSRPARQPGARHSLRDSDSGYWAD